MHDGRRRVKSNVPILLVNLKIFFQKLELNVVLWPPLPIQHAWDMIGLRPYNSHKPPQISLLSGDFIIAKKINSKEFLESGISQCYVWKSDGLIRPGILSSEGTIPFLHDNARPNTAEWRREIWLGVSHSGEEMLSTIWFIFIFFFSMKDDD